MIVYASTQRGKQFPDDEAFLAVLELFAFELAKIVSTKVPGREIRREDVVTHVNFGQDILPRDIEVSVQVLCESSTVLMSVHDDHIRKEIKTLLRRTLEITSKKVVLSIIPIDGIMEVT